MLYDILSSVRWEQLGVTVGFMAVVLIAHFVWARPLQRRAQAEMQKIEARRQTIELTSSISSITTGLMGDLREPINSEQLAVHTAKLQAAMHQVAGHPALLQAMHELLDATTKLAAASHADKHAQDSNALQVANACLAVELRLSALIDAATRDA